MTRTSILLIVILLAAAGLIAAQCGAAPAETQTEASAGPRVQIVEPFARASMPNGAVYMTLRNESDTPDALLSAQTDVAETVELHETTMGENEVMRMSPVEKIEIPAGGSVQLEPGGLHVMLLGLKEGIAKGDKISLTLNFAESGSQTIEVEVTEGMTMNHNQMEHGDGESQ